jgi:hypothetical protein
MTEEMKTGRNDAANPLNGRPPAPEEVQDDRPGGENPNASTHFEVDPDWKARPARYPAAKTGLLNTDVPKNKAKK